MDLNYKITIIVPIYNAQDTIENTVQSIISQSYKKLEIILVNDGSTDTSLEICKNLQLKDSRIKIINKQNGGVSSARNVGISHATGQYIIHADSDDIVLPDAYLNLINEAKQSNADIVVGSYYSGIENDFIENIPNDKIIDPVLFSKKIIENKAHAGLWNKLVISSLYENFKFQEGLNYKEDMIFFVTKLMGIKPKISIIKNPVYFYYTRSNSITNQNFDKNVEKNFRVIKIIENLNYPNLEYSIRVQKAYANIGYILNKKDSKYVYSDFYPKINVLDLNIPIKYRLLLLFEKYSISFLSNIYLKIKGLMK